MKQREEWLLVAPQVVVHVYVREGLRVQLGCHRAEHVADEAWVRSQ